MLDFAQVVLRLFGFAVLLSAVLGFLNRATGWNLALGIGGFTIPAPPDAFFAGVLLVLGAGVTAFSFFLESEASKKPKVWVGLALALVLGLPALGMLLERLSFRDTAHWAAAHGDRETLEAELLASSSPKEQANRVLFEAVFHDQVEVVKWLLEEGGANPNATRAKDLGEGRETPILSWAAWYASPEVTELFLARGADPNRSDTFGFTPLMMAAAYRKVDTPKAREATLRVVSALLAKGADPRQETKLKQSAESLAKQYARPKILALLKGEAR